MPATAMPTMAPVDRPPVVEPPGTGVGTGEVLDGTGSVLDGEGGVVVGGGVVVRGADRTGGVEPKYPAARYDGLLWQMKVLNELAPNTTPAQ